MPLGARRSADARRSLVLTGLLAALACAALVSVARADLMLDIHAAGGNAIGQVRLHVGTSNFGPYGNEGIGRATSTSEYSGFYPQGTLGQAATAAGVHHFNWLQIVTQQPASHDTPFGAVPHLDPSSDPHNTTPHDANPFYLNESPDGTRPWPTINPPFDLPTTANTLLSYQDFPSGFTDGESIAFDTFLVSILSPYQHTYDLLAGFTWRLDYYWASGEPYARAHLTNLAAIAPELSPAFQAVVSAYSGLGWTLVPEPSAAMLLACLAVISCRRAARNL